VILLDTADLRPLEEAAQATSVADRLATLH